MVNLNPQPRFGGVLFFTVLLLSVTLVACAKRRAYEEIPVMKAELDGIVSDIGLPVSGKRDDVEKSAIASVGYYYIGNEAVKRVSSLWVIAAAKHDYGLPGSGKSYSGDSYKNICHNTLPHRYVTLIKHKGEEKVELIITSEAYEVSYPDCAAPGV